ncbi:hypothetical protein UA08_03974 [Talaromyces atroroseus]|uniref:Trichodiene oxygenase n=1 Tax=Talaromyces atroroseus TaxID=1441469 RepID=A0A1Q5Q8I9_TALAT|nr:hypothetical protein UA08_03974 [Talaromyces atroroseus]OKL60424.1 hypothetical protein UA08_03974 [Talaromyces atroroseus]
MPVLGSIFVPVSNALSKGPIVRINPHELHIRDSEFYEQLYAPAAKKRDKYKTWVILSGTPDASFSTVSHSHHRVRRNALNPFFSRQAVQRMQPLILEKVERLASRLSEAAHSQRVVRLDVAFMALTMDIICHYAFGESYNYLAHDDFHVEWKNSVISALENGIFLRNFPWALPLLKSIPYSVLKVLQPNAASLAEWANVVKQKVDNLLQENAKGNKSSGTIFQAMLDSNLPPEEKSTARLIDEGQSVVGAGSETTAGTLSVILFHLLQDKGLFYKLRQELASRPSKGSSLLQDLEKLPYLTAIIYEGLRLNVGVMSRSPRIAHEIVQYHDWQIPPGTPVSESVYFVHQDPKIFPEPKKFRPERWIEAQQNGLRLDRYMVCFSKGSRSCLGINLAYAELYLTLAKIIPRFEMELYETTIEDVEPARDFFVPVPNLDSKGVRAKVIAVL